MLPVAWFPSRAVRLSVAVVLGALIAQVSGEPFESYLEKHVLEPLAGYLWLAARLRSDPTLDAFNFGPTLESNRTVGTLVAYATARAVEVVQFLITQGMTSSNIGAAGYGENDPVADNKDEAGKAQNRRIEVILMPLLGDIPELKEMLTSGKS